VTEQPASVPAPHVPTPSTAAAPNGEHAGAATGAPDADAPAIGRRQPGDPHPYMLQRNPPNLWFLVMMTVLALGLAGLAMALTVVL